MSRYGEFSADDPLTTWLTESGEDRHMRVERAFWFKDPAGKQWDAPQYTVVDGASILRPFWGILGSPYTGDYRRASIVHDYACDHATTWLERLAADRMFFHACLEGGCGLAQATILYIGVRFGAWLVHHPSATTFPYAAAAVASKLSGPRTRLSDDEEWLIADFQSLAHVIQLPGSTDDPAELERRTTAALEALAAYYAGGNRDYPPPGAMRQR